MICTPNSGQPELGVHITRRIAHNPRHTSLSNVYLRVHLRSVYLWYHVTNDRGTEGYTMTAKTKTQIEEMKNQTIGVEVEMNSIT